MIRAKLLPEGRLVQVLPDATTRPLPDRTDWAKLDAMTDEDIHGAAVPGPLSDPQLAIGVEPHP